MPTTATARCRSARVWGSGEGTPGPTTSAGLQRETVAVRGREQPLEVIVLMNGEELANHLEQLEAAE